MADHGRGLFASVARAVVRFRALTLLIWVAAAALMNVLVPQLETVVERVSQPVMPQSAESVKAFEEMDRRFGGTGAQSMAFVVLVNEDGLTQADRAYYAHLAKHLRNNGHGITDVQDIDSHPEFKRALTSRDGQSIYLPVGMTGGVGSPEANRQIEYLRDVSNQNKPESLQTYVTGASATMTDLLIVMHDSIAKITVVTVIGIGIVLLLIYRSIVTAAIALATIGVALALSRSVTALLGLHLVDVSTFTGAFLTAIVLGAGTDYSIFLISRFHEERRKGVAPLEAVVGATRRVSAVIAASGATVIAASASMALADLGFYRTSGPAIAVSIFVTLLTALTLTPALLALASMRGRADAPSRMMAGGVWASVGSLVTRRPVAVLLLGLLMLGALAAFYPGMRPSFDERAVQPASTESNRGYRALDDHFPAGEVLPDYVMINADHDMRNARDLAALEATADAISRVKGVETVRGVTRPQGKPIGQASVGYQAGEVGRRLKSASGRLEASEQGTRSLSDGASRVAGGLRRLADGARQATTATDRMLDGLSAQFRGLGKAVDGTGKAAEGARKLTSGTEELAKGLHLAHDQTKLAVDGLRTALSALQSDPICTADPTCKRAREGIARIHAAQRDQLLPGLAKAAAAADRLASGNGRLAGKLDELRSGLVAAQRGMDRMVDGQRKFKDKLQEMSTGTEKLAAGTDRISGGIGKFANSTQKLRTNLEDAAAFLLTTAERTQNPEIGGFYLPSTAFDDPRMALARGYYLSEDGRVARMAVLSKTNPFGTEAIERSANIRKAAHTAVRGTPLEGSQVLATGPAATNRDLDELSAADFSLIAVVVILSVLLILILLLRCVVTPLYLMASVILSFAAAMGLGVLVWQHFLGHDLHWSAAGIAFVILVAVGADYNLLLVSRMREESATGSRAGIARAVAATGGVITSAGMIFAMSFFAMIAGSITTLAQIGFTIGAGLLLDTFVIRTLVVPAVAALLGRWNWWPASGSRVGAQLSSIQQDGGSGASGGR